MTAGEGSELLHVIQAAIDARDRDALAAFGEIVAGELRAPFRLTLVARDGRIRNFHGSIPFGAG